MGQQKNWFFFYDFNVNPLSFGDFLYFIAAVNYQKRQLGLDRVTIALAASRDEHRVRATAERYGVDDPTFIGTLYKISTIKAMIDGEVKFLLYKNRNAFLTALRNTDMDVGVWPPLEIINSEVYIYYYVVDFLCSLDYLTSLASELRPPADRLQFASRFFSEARDENNRRIAINLRSHGRYGSDRNGDMKDWLDYIRYCLQKQYNLVLIGPESLTVKPLLATEERECIWFTSDVINCPLFDLAVVYCSDLMVGAASGFSIYPSLIRGGLGYSANSNIFRYRERYGASLLGSEVCCYLDLGCGVSYQASGCCVDEMVAFTERSSQTRRTADIHLPHYVNGL